LTKFNRHISFLFMRVIKIRFFFVALILLTSINSFSQIPEALLNTGTAVVFVSDSYSFVEIDGKAAEVLYKALEDKEEIDMNLFTHDNLGLRSRFVGNTFCNLSDNEYYCKIFVNHKENKNSSSVSKKQ